MALAETTLSSACSATDSSIVVASASSILPGRLFKIDGEVFQATKGYVVASTTVPVIRGQDGTAQAAHASSARVVHGDAADFGSPGAGVSVSYPPAGRSRKTVSISATGTLELPAPGQDLDVYLNGTTVINLTIPVPTKALDGCRLTVFSNGVAAHTLVFTGGLGGAAGAYTTVTQNATGPGIYEFAAADETWRMFVAVPMAGTVANITGTLS